jgi:hypothetical protein
MDWLKEGIKTVFGLFLKFRAGFHGKAGNNQFFIQLQSAA